MLTIRPLATVFTTSLTHGSTRAEEVEEACHEHGITLVNTGIRPFRR
jgi:AICAR transformylase/IMP cyclohydrolase PurH